VAVAAAGAQQAAPTREPASHIDRARRLVIVINSAAERPTDRASGQAQQEWHVGRQLSRGGP
jgi:hypothetical protein